MILFSESKNSWYLKSALIKSSDKELIESTKESLQASETVKMTTEQVEDAIKSTEDIKPNPVSSIKIKPSKTKQSKSSKP